MNTKNSERDANGRFNKGHTLSKERRVQMGKSLKSRYQSGEFSGMTGKTLCKKCHKMSTTYGGKKN